MNVVIDASTITGAARKVDSIPRQALLVTVLSHELVLSLPVFEEISEVLSRKKFARSIPEEVRTEILGMLLMSGLVAIPEETVCECRDPGDDIYLEAALAAGAYVIVSSNADLLVMDPWRGIRILKPREFLELVGARAGETT